MSDGRILGVRWFGGGVGKCIGIVKTKNSNGTIRYFIETVDGFDEQADMRRIADWGTPVNTEELKAFLTPTEEDKT